MKKPLLSRSPRWLRSAVLALFAASLGFAQISQRPSPFVARGKNTTPAAAVSQAPADAILEFSGVMSMGTSTLVCITTLSDKRSRWIKVGEAASGIQVLNYDGESGTASVRHNGREVVLPIKQPSYDPSALAAYQPTIVSGPAPMAGVAPAVAVTDEEKETEARMLVSDLLEIGMIQRQAYQEAQTRERDAKRAETQGAPNGIAPVPAPQSPPAPR